MPCYHPISGYRAKSPNSKGNYPIVFNLQEGAADRQLTISCGRCIGCRLDSSREKALRCVHEQSLHTENCFITLTYDPEYLPESGSLDRREWQLFMKLLRQKVRRDDRKEWKLHRKIDPRIPKLKHRKVRFFMCGEYGTDQDITSLNTIGRPHYHAIIFGYQFPDLVLAATNKGGNDIYTSETLSKIWGKGFCSIAEANYTTAAYVARYIMKKINGDKADDHYNVDKDTGELRKLLPEFTGASNRPGIGYKWFMQYRHDTDKGYITVKGVKHPIPKYYNMLYKKHFDDEFCYIAEERQQAIDEQDPENFSDRLAVKERIKKRKIKNLNRNIS